MFVRDWMTASPVTIGEETTVGEARWLLKAHRFRRLPVLRGGVLVGLVTDRDLREAAPSSVDLSSPEDYRETVEATQVATIMSRDLATVEPDDTLEAAAHAMYERRIGGLPVVEGGRLVGILTETDVFRALVEVLGFREPRARLVLDLQECDPPLWKQLRDLEGRGLQVASVVSYRSRKGGPTRAVVSALPSHAPAAEPAATTPTSGVTPRLR
ncbi:MAG: CBS domain-containing protein [Planctomycetales bacterium]|nr:CBS domain-containing protein [Planctomycetales bacterium]